MAKNPTFSIQQPLLNKALQTCGKALSDNKIIPICEMFLFDLSETSLRISACDLRTSISTEILITEKTGTWPKIAVPGRKLADYISKSANEILVFELDINIVVAHEKQHTLSGETYTVKEVITTSLIIKSATGRLSLPTEPGEDFPIIKLDDDLHSISIPAPDFMEMLFRTMFSISDDELRPAATGLNLKGGKNVTVTSCAWQTISIFTFPIEIAPVNIILPKTLLLQIQSLNPTGSIGLQVCNRSAKITTGNIEICALLIDEKFPDCESVIPTQNDVLFKCDRVALIKALKRVMPFTDMGKLIILSLSSANIILTAKNIDYSELATETLAGEMSGSDDFTIGVNGDELAPILNSITSELVCFAFSTPTRAIIITEQFQTGKENLILLMPLIMRE